MFTVEQFRDRLHCMSQEEFYYFMANRSCSECPFKDMCEDEKMRGTCGERALKLLAKIPAPENKAETRIYIVTQVNDAVPIFASTDEEKAKMKLFEYLCDEEFFCSDYNDYISNLTNYDVPMSKVEYAKDQLEYYENFYKIDSILLND